MGLIMGQFESENRELFALEFGNIAESDFFLHSSIYKVGQNLYNHKITDEFDYGCNQTRTLRVI